MVKTISSSPQTFRDFKNGKLTININYTDGFSFIFMLILNQ